jgi:AmmeMemoRadiSam system protein A
MSKLFERPLEMPAGSLPNAAAAKEFSSQQRLYLLRLAHEAILAKIDGGSHPAPAPDSEWLAEHRGVFTTLYLHGQLRGCVGYAMPIAPLLRAVTETACAAAFDDTRFVPVTAEEAHSLEISLSILSPLALIPAEEVVVGRHGLLISEGARRGLLLPQVPVENGWDRETFLQQTCRKAGLPLDAWGKGATIEAFTAEVFGDTRLGDSETGDRK